MRKKIWEVTQRGSPQFLLCLHAPAPVVSNPLSQTVWLLKIKQQPRVTLCPFSFDATPLYCAIPCLRALTSNGRRAQWFLKKLEGTISKWESISKDSKISLPMLITSDVSSEVSQCM